MELKQSKYPPIVSYLLSFLKANPEELKNYLKEKRPGRYYNQVPASEYTYKPTNEDNPFANMYSGQGATALNRILSQGYQEEKLGME